jgi:magnesium transporter
LCRLKEGTNIRKNGADDLLYGLLDAIVDNYFLIVEDIGEKIDTVEDELLLNPKKEILQKIYTLKRDLIYIRNSLWPMRNVISSLSKNDYDLIDGKTIYYLRDVYDHVIQMIDIIETYRDICSGMLDTYLSSIGNKTNEVMKVLTIFSTIFIPLTFLAGVYGMNFRYLPELNWKYGYFSFWIISIIIIILMLRFFRKKDWL